MPEIILIDKSDRFLFTPFLYELVTGEMQEWEIAPTFTELLANTGIQFVQGVVTNIDFAAQQVELNIGQRSFITYDRLVLAIGGETPMNLVAGASEYAIPFRNLTFAGFAGFLFYAQAAEKIWVKCVVAGALATNIAFLCVAMVFLLQNTGTRGLHHGTGIVEVSRAVSEMCAQGKSMGKNNFSLDVAPVFTPDNAIKYFFDRNEPCRGMNLTITRLAWPNVDARLTYDASTATSARLLTEWKP